MSWDEELSLASFRGIEFNVLSVGDAFSRRVVEHKYPYRDGADLEDIGREPRETTLQAVFHGEGALSDLGSLIALWDEGKTGLFQHPLLGSWQTKIISMQVQHEASSRDTSTVDITFKQDGIGSDLPTPFSIETEKKNIREAADEVDAELANLDEDIPEVSTATADARQFIDDISDELDDTTTRYEKLRKLSNDGVSATRNTDREDYETANLTMAIFKMMLAARRVKEAVEAVQPNIIEVDVPRTTSTASLAKGYYQDGTRGDEIQKLNRIENPFVTPPGRVRVYDR